MDSIKLIASDMDHTLLTENGELPPNLDNYILELEKLGIDFVIASGRPLFTLEEIFPKIKHKMSFICNNGALVYYNGEMIFKNLLKPAIYQAMSRFVEDETDAVALICGLDSAYVHEKFKMHEQSIRIFYSKITFVENLSNVDVDANKFTVYCPNRNSKEYYEKVFKPMYGSDFSVTVGDTVWLHIMNFGINKGYAISLLAERLGLKGEQMMAFGDTYNDIEMLQAVKHSYIVKNASADMKQYANFIADSNDNFGVIKVIDKVIQGRLKV
jgi:Cof subfamily protein (haloacid dehalogenase superfamily)